MKRVINSGREWDWMDDECRIHRAIDEAMLEEEGVLLSDEVDPREF